MYSGCPRPFCFNWAAIFGSVGSKDYLVVFYMYCVYGAPPFASEEYPKGFSAAVRGFAVRGSRFRGIRVGGLALVSGLELTGFKLRATA